MEISTGVICLKELYDLVLSEKRNESHLDGRSDFGRSYGKRCDSLAATIPTKQGFYLWGRYDKNRLWRNIYLGKAGIGKSANLRNRIREELKDERGFIWCAFLEKDVILRFGEMLYPRKWNEYKRGFARAFLKAEATHIVWVSTHLSNEDVIRVEADLIESLNPTANIRRPPPPNSLQQDTAEIFEKLRTTIHGARETGFVAPTVNLLPE